LIQVFDGFIGLTVANVVIASDILIYFLPLIKIL